MIAAEGLGMRVSRYLGGILGVFALVAVASADVVELRNGHRVEGTVTKESPEDVGVELERGMVFHFKRDEVRSIRRAARTPAPAPPNTPVPAPDRAIAPAPPPPAVARPSTADETLRRLGTSFGLTLLDSTAAPAFTLTDLGGRTTSLAELNDRPVLLYFWTTW